MFPSFRAGLCVAILACSTLFLSAATTEPANPANGPVPTTTASINPPTGGGTNPAVTVPPGAAAPPTVPPSSTAPSNPSGLPAVIAPVVQPPNAAPTPTPSGVSQSSAPPVGTPISLGTASDKELEKSVVQIFTSFREPNWSAPWIFDMGHAASGTGFLIDGDRIMTNAHVVAWTTQLVVRKYHDPSPYLAHVEYVGHDVDLAVIKVDDPSFYEGMKPLQFGPLPKVRSAVVTYGFPAGGQQISYTRGVVSRIEVQGYVHAGNKAFLACQTDAAINPGNSGGPVIQDDKVVGVAFEGVSGLQSTGYFIPTVIINHFLDDIKDGVYDGVPEAGLRLSPLQNPAFRHMLKLPADSKQGVRVDEVIDIPETAAVIKPDDVIMQIGDYPVDEDGTITYDGNTVGASAAIDLAQSGETIPMKILRDGQMMDIKLPVKAYHGDDEQGNQYDVLPKYYIYGGLVFTPLSLDYLKTFGSDWSDSAGRELIYELAYRHLEDPKNWRPEPVVLASILDAPVNANFATRGQAMVDKINGIKIEQLSDVPKAFAAAKGADSIIEFLPNHHFEVIRTADAEKANPGILSTYSVPAQSRL